MRRRQFLAGSLGLAAGSLAGCHQPDGSHLQALPAAPADGRLPWSNWSGLQRAYPAQRLAPRSEDELAELLRRGAPPLRPAGAGHSFTALVPTDGTLLSLRHFEGVIEHDPVARTATVGAGTRLGALAEALHGLGQALPNMPDVDQQTLAGALATATHGTGERLGALHAYVSGLRLVTARGEVIDCSARERPALFEAARVSLGSLGVITRVQLQNVAPYRLRRRVWAEPLGQMLERFDEYAARHHSFEFYYLPFCSQALGISIDPTEDLPRPRGADPDNDAVMQLKQLRDLLHWAPAARRWLLAQALADYPTEEAVDDWHRIYPSARAVRFNEMEYHLPREALLPTLRTVIATLERDHPEEFFPVEVRVVRGDDAWLSPFYGHATSGSIAVHRFHEENPFPLFAAIEPLYQAVGGRPHWGKLHGLGAAELAGRYPRWSEFLALRAELDPEGRLLNPHLKQVFGLG
ncbi:MAG TPA: D-arabinono-1,4-lactone oxidase [Nevskiaceae bacterium]|nr:D-arabinono-1,4-lactone oxidase [Nevskiaceae bacterium]